MLSPMDRRSRARWQAAAKLQREWYSQGGKLNRPLWSRSRSVVEDVRFKHNALLMFARRGDVYDQYWWA